MNTALRSQLISAALTLAIGTIHFQASAESTSSTASDNRPPPNSGGHPPGPPPEALQACSGKASGAACSFNGREGVAISGQCFGPPPNIHDGAGPSSSSSTALACRPERDNNPPPAPPANK